MLTSTKWEIELSKLRQSTSWSCWPSSARQWAPGHLFECSFSMRPQRSWTQSIWSWECIGTARLHPKLIAFTYWRSVWLPYLTRWVPFAPRRTFIAIWSYISLHKWDSDPVNNLPSSMRLGFDTIRWQNDEPTSCVSFSSISRPLGVVSSLHRRRVVWVYSIFAYLERLSQYIMSEVEW